MSVHEGEPASRKSSLDLARDEAINRFEEQYFTPDGLYQDPEQIIEMQIGDIATIVNGTIEAVEKRRAIKSVAYFPYAESQPGARRFQPELIDRGHGQRFDEIARTTLEAGNAQHPEGSGSG